MISEVILYGSKKGAQPKIQRADVPLDRPIIFVRLNERDALRLIRSLASQLDTRNPNTDREEFHFSSNLSDGWPVEFTVSAHKEPANA